MREILFRGKRVGDGRWSFGAYIPYESGETCILSKKFSAYGHEATELCGRDNVIPETVGQYTGLSDKNGTKIFEGDILKIAKKSDGVGEYYIPPLEYPVNVVVRWDLCSWTWETLCADKYYISFPDAWCHFECEVIGNIYDNPELLKGEQP